MGLPFVLHYRQSTVNGDVALAQLYRALDDQALLAQANARVKALAGERDVERSVY